MTKKTAPKEALEELHAHLANALTAKILSGEITAAELNVARQFLKDNKIDAQPTAGSPLDALKDALPFALPRPDPDEIASEETMQ